MVTTSMKVGPHCLWEDSGVPKKTIGGNFKCTGTCWSSTNVRAFKISPEFLEFPSDSSNVECLAKSVTRSKLGPFPPEPPEEMLSAALFQTSQLPER